jgi:hypothetical protein
MKKFALLLSIVVLAFSAGAQASYLGTGLIGAPMIMSPLSGVNPYLIMAPSPSLMLAPLYMPRPILTPYIMPTVSVLPSLHTIMPVSPLVQPGSNVQVSGFQYSTIPSSQVMDFSVIANTN